LVDGRQSIGIGSGRYSQQPPLHAVGAAVGMVWESGTAPGKDVKIFFHKLLAGKKKPRYYFVLGNNATTGP